MNRPTKRRRRWLKRISVLPTLMTLSNLLCGFIAIVLVLEAGKYLQAGTGTVDDSKFYPRLMSYACWFIFVGMVFDLLDGHMARLTKSVSGFGKEIDSLADCVTFGVAPAVIVWQLGSANLQLVGDPGKLVAPSVRILWAILAVYVACSAMRLARYNVETNRAPPNTFFGLPSPAAAGAVASLVLLRLHLEYYAPDEFLWIGSGAAVLSLLGRGLGHAIPLLTLVIGVLMITRIYYIHAGKKLLRGKRSFTHVVVLLLAAAMLFTYPEGALALLFCGYVLWGLAGEVRLRLKAPEEIRRRKALVRGASPPPADGGASDVREKTP